METVVDELDDDPRVLHGRGDRPRFAMTQSVHRVEHVRHDSGFGVEGPPDHGVVGVLVVDGRDHAHAGKPISAIEGRSRGPKSGSGSDMIRDGTMRRGVPSSPEPGTRPYRSSGAEEARINETRTKEGTGNGRGRKNQKKKHPHQNQARKPESQAGRSRRPGKGLRNQQIRKTQHHQTATMRVLHPPRRGTPRTASFVGRVMCLDGFLPDIATNPTGSVSWAWTISRDSGFPAVGFAAHSTARAKEATRLWSTSFLI